MRIPNWIAGLSVITVLAGCSGAPVKKADDSAAEAWNDSTIEIDYSLGHSRRRIVIVARNGQVSERTYRQETALKLATPDVARYHEFYDHLSSFVEARRGSAAGDPGRDPADCRDPYTVVLSKPAGTVKVSGCRMRDTGSFSRLVQEGEFLIYRQK